VVVPLHCTSHAAHQAAHSRVASDKESHSGKSTPGRIIIRRRPNDRMIIWGTENVSFLLRKEVK
jgi:hypothetical protein